MIPWGLTPREAEAMDAYLRTGILKLVADELGCALKTANQHVNTARDKMGHRMTLHAALAWHDWRKHGVGPK